MKLMRQNAAEWQWERTQTADEQVWTAVQQIVQRVRTEGEKAVREFIREHDKCPGAGGVDWPLLVPVDALKQAWESLPGELQDALEAARDRIRTFHEAQKPRDVHVTGSDGERLGMVWRPIERVGVYAPGGRAAYPSTALMDIVPAQVAGVDNLILCSPPQPETGLPHPLVMAVAWLTGVTNVYRIGGAHAIAAMAYGVGSVAKVDKVVGPGNLYVALAKRLVAGEVGIDSIAGPSEVFIVADDTADAAYVAADMIAQAEHDAEAGAVCIITSEALAGQVEVELDRQLASLPKAEIARAALERWGRIVIAASVEEAIDAVNRSAPEHVELHVRSAPDWLGRIRAAGSVFLGPHTPEPVGDYYAGTNHVLPTHGSARFASGLGVADFLRRMTYVEYAEETLRRHAEHITRLAEAEGLRGHAQSVRIRLNRPSGQA